MNKEYFYSVKEHTGEGHSGIYTCNFDKSKDAYEALVKDLKRRLTHDFTFYAFNRVN